MTRLRPEILCDAALAGVFLLGTAALLWGAWVCAVNAAAWFLGVPCTTFLR